MNDIKEITVTQIFCGIFLVFFSYGTYYVLTNFIYNCILYIHASENSNYVTDIYKSTSLESIISIITIAFIFNMILFISVSCKYSIHLFPINISNHKYCMIFIYTILLNFKCDDNIYINCTIAGENLDVDSIKNSKSSVLYVIFILFVIEIFSSMINRCKKYYISKNIFFEILGSIIVYNLLSIIFISVIFLIMCIFSGLGNDNCCNDLHMNSYINGTERHIKIHKQDNDEFQDNHQENVDV